MELARALGDEEHRPPHARAADPTRRLRNLRRQLWQPDLGRFLCYRDGQGIARQRRPVPKLPLPRDLGHHRPAGQLDLAAPRPRDPDRPARRGLRLQQLSLSLRRHLGHAGRRGPAALGRLGPGGHGSAQRDLARPQGGAPTGRWTTTTAAPGPKSPTSPTPAYFSPPAGLYIAATVEALFGLQVRKPEGQLLVSPSFPDAWPEAKLHLPEYRADYTRRGNTLEYLVESNQPLARQVRWFLPPARVTQRAGRRSARRVRGHARRRQHRRRVHHPASTASKITLSL